MTSKQFQFKKSGSKAERAKAANKFFCALVLSGFAFFSLQSLLPSDAAKERKASCCSGKAIAAADSKDSKSSTENKDKGDKAADSKAVERKAVLEPANIAGFASFGYAAAKSCPEVMEKLFCYCGCDMTDSHTSLLDCFTSLHGVDCHICQEEALLAMKLNKEGIPIKEIQKTVDEKYSTQYPFEQDTATYKKYKATRLYNAAGSETPAATTSGSDAQSKNGTQTAGPEAPEEVSEGKPKLKKGRKIGKCCSGGEHAKEHAGDSKDKKEKSKQ